MAESLSLPLMKGCGRFTEMMPPDSTVHFTPVSVAGLEIVRNGAHAEAFDKPDGVYITIFATDLNISVELPKK